MNTDTLLRLCMHQSKRFMARRRYPQSPYVQADGLGCADSAVLDDCLSFFAEQRNRHRVA